MEEKFTVKDAAIKNGIILGLISTVLGLVSNMMRLYEDTTISIVLGVVGLGITIYFFVMGHNAYKANNGGFMTLGQGIGIGTLMTVVSVVISQVVNYVYVAFVDDSSIQYRLEESLRSMEDRGMDQAAIDQAMPMVETFNSPMAILIIGLLVGTLFGFIIALIVSLFTKRADPSMEL